jgi:glutathione S-transferase
MRGQGRPSPIYAAGIDQALQADRRFLVGDGVSLADICFVAELCLFLNERHHRPTLDKRGLKPILPEQWREAFPRASSHFNRLIDHPAFAPDVQPYLQKLYARAA